MATLEQHQARHAAALNQERLVKEALQDQLTNLGAELADGQARLYLILVASPTGSCMCPCTCCPQLEAGTGYTSGSVLESLLSCCRPESDLLLLVRPPPCTRGAN